MSKIIDTFGDKPALAVDDAPAAVTGGFQDLVAKLNGNVRAAVPSQKVALAIPVTTVAKGDTTTIELQPQVDFKGERLIITESGGSLSGVAGAFSIDSIKVGRDEQLIASGGIPGDVFASTSQRVIGLNMKTCPTSLKIYITVTNLDAAAAHVFSGMLVGSCGGCNEDTCGVPVPGGADYEPLVALGIPRTAVAKGATTTIEVTVEEMFRGQQLVIPSLAYETTAAAIVDISQYFTIDSIKVGREEQLLSTDALAASLFSASAQQDIGLSMKPCPTSLKIYVTVTNLDSGNARDFSGAFYGFCGENGNCNTGLCGLDIGQYPMPVVTPGSAAGPYQPVDLRGRYAVPAPVNPLR